MGEVAGALGAREVLGAAALSYLDAVDVRPAPGAGVTTLDPGHPDLAALRGGVPPDEDAESGLTKVEPPVFVARAGRTVVAAAGYRRWPGRTAHLSGLARLVASAAVAHALGAGLLPQWRARPVASRRVAAGLGFREHGAQVSLRFA